MLEVGGQVVGGDVVELLEEIPSGVEVYGGQGGRIWDPQVLYLAERVPCRSVLRARSGQAV